ncbi:DUF72 domain-containing protein [Pedobacter yulinensis]|uniref:DUF72 domain-containing protein n=1 Tax=Pedobacter yulinensis TaxID=2126353 RepID=A0A2T3HKD1_9SPHI|nr:DUF72 domain-containing protein [Pedobacter yulinensis]PST82902.1 DUF72 domain-containing protein [Pedobacter yulinensis]
MEFGKVPAAELAAIDFTLPSDGASVAALLPGQPHRDAAFYVGCAKWGRKEWKGMLYPQKVKEADFLDEYVKHFNSIEMNATFYGVPSEEQVLKWREKTTASNKDGFIFVPKFSRTISHIRRLNNAGADTDQFLKNISAFGSYLGPVFLQLSDNFGPKSYDVLENYLQHLPQDLRVFVELRHQEWFADQNMRRQTLEMLERQQKGLIMTDTSGRRDLLHMELTIPEAFIRFVGNNDAASDRKRIDMWVARLEQWLKAGLQRVYFFLHQHDESDTPRIAAYTIDLFNRYLGSNISPLVLNEPVPSPEAKKQTKRNDGQETLFQL